MKLVKNIILKLIHSYGYRLIKASTPNSIEEINKYEKELIETCSKYSMTTSLNMWSLLQSFYYIKNNNIEGDFVECGVWKGGNLILLQKLMEKYKIKKNIFAYDTFEGMPEPTNLDFKYDGSDGRQIFKHKKNNDIKWVYSSIDEVKKNLSTNCKSKKNIKLIKGMVEKTLMKKNNIPEKISILRLDTDFYESTKIEMKILFPRLVKGGVLIIDDYGNWLGARKAIDEYFENKTKPFLHFVDHSSRLHIKT